MDTQNILYSCEKGDIVLIYIILRIPNGFLEKQCAFSYLKVFKI